MVGRFFVRFNLHNSICSYPASFPVLRPLVDISDAELSACLEEIEQTHIQRAKRLSESYAHELDILHGKSVAFIGDSITSDNFGYRRTVTCAAELKAFDGAVSGGTSSTVLHSSKALISSKNSEIVSIMLGTNDSVCIDSTELSQVSIEEYERNMRAILNWSTQSGAAVVLFEIPPIIPDRFEKSFSPQSKYQSLDNIEKFNTVLRSVAKEFGITPISNAYLNDLELFEQDGIHLNLKGQELFAERWICSASKIIKEKNHENN